LVCCDTNFKIGNLTTPFIHPTTPDPNHAGIRKLLMARPGIDNVQSVQSQWIGPYTFAYKAEVDFDGTYLAAKLMARCVVNRDYGRPPGRFRPHPDTRTHA
jgi:hypothetical protein